MGFGSLFGEGRFEVSFKRGGDGWIYQTPAARPLFGLSRSYRVDDAQKAEIEAILMRCWKRIALPAFPVMLLLILASVPILRQSLYVLAFGAIIGALMGLAISAVYCAKLRPVLRQAAESAERITWRDRFRTTAEIMSIPQIVVAGLAFLILLTLRASRSVTSGLSLPDAVFLLIFGLLTLQYSALLFVKLRNRSRPA